MNPQLLQAGRRGSEVVSRRADLKRSIKLGETPCESVLEEHPVPDWLKTMRVDDLLCAIPGFSIKIVEPLLESIPIKGGAQLGELTYRKRRVLSDRIAAWKSAPPKVSGKRARPGRPVLSGAAARVVAAAESGDGEAAAESGDGEE